MTLIQGAGVDWPGPEIVTYSWPSVRKSAEPVEEFEIGRTERGGRSGERRGRLRGRELDRLDRRSMRSS